MSQRILLFLLIFAVGIVLLAVSVPVKKISPANMQVIEESSEIGDEESVSDLFKVERRESKEVLPLPTDVPKDEACNLDGQMVREGTVASNTICINEDSELNPSF